MTEDERVAVCKAITISCMWGHGGIGSVILDRLDKTMPHETSWRKLHDDNAKETRRDSVGVISDRDELERKLRRGFWLTNWDEDGCALFNPPPMNGLDMYVSKPLADAYRFSE